MFALFDFAARIGQRLATRSARLGHAAIPRSLLENAGARAGSNPRQAHELRQAALAYLRVVR